MNIIEHQNKSILEDKLCKEISGKLQTAILQDGYANILFSGGSTPKGLFLKLSKEEIPWTKVTIGLVDDRFVPVEDEKSNEALLRESFLINNAKEANLLGLVYDINSKENNLVLASKVYGHFHSKIDVSILGMGGDGHTASLFPNDEASREALGDDFHNILLNSTADVKPYERVSCSRYLLFKSSSLYLMITGKEKLNVLNSAKNLDLPISYFFETNQTKLIVHYSEK